MRVIVTAGPTRAYIDVVRFITNASSGQMGYAVAAAATKAGCDVTLLTGPVALPPPKKCSVVPFETVRELTEALRRRFAACDALVMAAAVGDFTVRRPFERKLHRSAGQVELRLDPTEDVVAGMAAEKRADQTVVVFAVEDGTQAEGDTRAREKLRHKHADYVVVNTPAAIAADQSHACILSRDGVALPWANRPKKDLAEQIVKLLKKE
jgi:phosphopantothenoylcysteine decarboxylase/phosphopantothenate--cysteine ligase